MSLFAELKRRNVFKVGAAYAVVAWVLIQIVVAIEEPLHLPGWFDTGIIVMLAIGLPIALLIAWAFELTPEGIKPSSEINPEESITSVTGHKLNIFISGILALAVIFLVVDNYVFVDSPASASTEQGISIATANNQVETIPQENTIAIIPFVNISDDPAQEYFSDGLTEEMINKLSRVDRLRVTGRDSAFYFKGRENERDEIREKLSVNYLLQGSVRKGNEQIRINAQLLDLANNQTLWSQTYDRELTDVLAVQDEIAEQVTTAMSVTLQAGEFDRPGMTSDAETYDAFLKSQELSRITTNQVTTQNLDALIAQSELIVRMDPDFALGWVALWSTYFNLATVLNTGTESEIFQQRRQEALEMARSLEPNMPELYMADMMEELSKNNWLEAEQYANKLLDQFGTRDANLNTQFSRLLHNLGRFDDSMRYAQQARLLDPLDPQTHWRVASTYTYQNRIEESRAATDQGLALNNGFEQFLRGNMAVTAWVEKDRQFMSEILGTNNLLGNAEVTRLWIEGRDEEALQLLRNISVSEDLPPLSNVVYSEWAAVLDDPELALELTSRHSDVELVWLPLFSEMRKLPAFKEFVLDAGLYDYWRSTGNWGDYCRPLPDTESDFECF